MEIHPETYFSIYTKNEPGKLAKIMATLVEGGIDLSGLWGSGESHGNARVVAVPHDHTKFRQVAADAGWRITEGICFRLEGQDSPGALVEVLNKIAEEKLNIVALDAISVDDHFGCYLWGSEADQVTLSQVLGLRVALT